MESTSSSPAPRPFGALPFPVPSFVHTPSRGIECFFSQIRFVALACVPFMFRVVLSPQTSQGAVIAPSLVEAGAPCQSLKAQSPAPLGEGVHQCGNAVGSCRLCLIACNSRQFDAQESECD
jgi:hypothetical protein